MSTASGPMLGKPPRPSLGGAHGNNDNRKGKTATGTSGHGHHKSRRDKKKQKQKQKQKQRKPHETRAERNARINAEQRQRRLAAIAKARSMERVMMRLRRRGMPIPGPGEPVPTEEDVPATPRREFMSMPSDALDRALQAENVKGNRVAQVVGTQYVVDDFNLLEQDVLTCQVCKVGLPGCPCCWTFRTVAEEMPTRHDPLNMTSNALIRVGNRFQVGGPLVGTTAACDHTGLLTTLEIHRWRHNKMKQFTVIIKVLPSGQAVKFGVLHTYDINYIVFQFRSLAGAEGTDEKLELLLPTEVGAFHLSTEYELPTDFNTPFENGTRTLEEYHCTQRNSIIALFRVPWVHHEKTPAIIDAWVRMNFTLDKMWEARIHHHFDELPPLLPGNDKAQLLLGPWLDDALRQLAVQAEEDRQKAKEREAKLKLAMEHARKEAAVARMKVTNSVQAKEERRKWRQSVREARKKATEEKKRERERQAQAKLDAEREAAEVEARKRADEAEKHRTKTPAELRMLRKRERQRSKRSGTSGGGFSARSRASSSLGSSRPGTTTTTTARRMSEATTGDYDENNNYDGDDTTTVHGSSSVGDGSDGAGSISSRSSVTGSVEARHDDRGARTRGGALTPGMFRTDSGGAGSACSSSPTTLMRPPGSPVRVGASVAPHLPGLMPPSIAEAEVESLGSRGNRSSVSGQSPSGTHAGASTRSRSRSATSAATRPRPSPRDVLQHMLVHQPQPQPRHQHQHQHQHPHQHQHVPHRHRRDPSRQAAERLPPRPNARHGGRGTPSTPPPPRSPGVALRSAPSPLVHGGVQTVRSASEAGAAAPQLSHRSAYSQQSQQSQQSQYSQYSQYSQHSQHSQYSHRSMYSHYSQHSQFSRSSHPSQTSFNTASAPPSAASSVASAISAGLAMAQSAMAAAASTGAHSHRSMSSVGSASSFVSASGSSYAGVAAGSGGGRARASASHHSPSHRPHPSRRYVDSGSDTGGVYTTTTTATDTDHHSVVSQASVSQMSYESAHAPLSTGAWRI